MAQRPPVLLVPEPAHPYAVGYIKTAYQRRGLRSVLLITNADQWLTMHRLYPTLKSGMIAATYPMTQENFREVCADICRRFTPLGAAAHGEEVVKVVGALQEPCGFHWNDVDVLGRFRNKGALKAHLRATAPHVPINYTRPVTSFEDLWHHPDGLPEKFVLKPNTGWGNRCIGFFDQTTPKETLRAFLEGASQWSTWLLEELMVGSEWVVNGLMDEHGDPHLINVHRYERTSINGRPNVYLRDWHVRRTEPEFPALTQYAFDVMRATGLKRSPFHMELFFTAQGPRLIEVGARYPGDIITAMMTDVHGGTFDPFDTSLHHYIDAGPYGPYPVSWDHYDRTSFTILSGIATADERVVTLQGKAEVERLPEFVRWVLEPRIGMKIRRTVDLYTMPYAVQLMSMRGDDHLREVSEYVRRTLTWNRVVRRRDKVVALGKKVRERGRVEAQRVMDRVLPGARLPVGTTIDR